MKFKTLYLSVAVAASIGTANAATFLTSGPYDAPAFEYDSIAGFEAEIHDEANAAALDPADHIFLISNLSTTTFQMKEYVWLPSDATDAANNGVPFIGVGLEELDPGDWVNGEIIITFSGLNYTGSGAGEFIFWSDSPVETVHFDSSDGAGDSLNTLAGSHIHYNWGFSDPGTYEITFGISGTHVTDLLQTGSQTYTFQVVPEPSSALLAGFGALAMLRRKR